MRLSAMTCKIEEKSSWSVSRDRINLEIGADTAKCVDIISGVG
jgi:hypothetical protein